MGKKQRIIFLIVISIIITIILSIGLTTAFMKPIEQGGNLTEIALSSCAKIKLTSTSSINLSNTYPMSRNKGFETSPYNFTITSYCDTYVGFNLYIATLSTNTLDASNIHYILTYKGSKDVIKEGILSSVTSGVSDFSDTEKIELNTGLKGTYGNIYKLHNESLALKGSKDYSLYLYVDESATNDTMNKTFSAGVAVKAYERENASALNEVCTNNQTLKDCITEYGNYGLEGTNLYHHDSSLDGGAGDNSYRYAGPSEEVNNFVCFGSDAAACPANNLYRIIGLIDGKIKLIRYDYMSADELGTDGDYNSSSAEGIFSSNYYKGSKEFSQIGLYHWNGNFVNSWSDSELNNTNLNTNFINKFNTNWIDKIATTTWIIGGNTFDNIVNSIPAVAYQNEIVNPISTDETTYEAKIGLMYVSDYYYAMMPSWDNVWNNICGSDEAERLSWMYMGMNEWTITRNADDTQTQFGININGCVNFKYMGEDVYNVNAARAVFYLEPTVKYVSGSGTMSDPIRIN